MVGDIIRGVEGGKKKRRKRKRVGGTGFTWVDEEGNDDGKGYTRTIAVRWHRRPALSDIIDEQDEIDFVEGRSDD